jgi:CTD nuclear envelope phosphatase 1|eukprot:TRINITY_DN9495_c0_g1_i1.p1 TRINITY_DN9495_c0_g1~~TRINITY_DN9495_c0_g1_i1.p1  ORF type:complete len:267 (+),score=13.50 TRINITY_DN9495_c0_g1_i1:46-846(+)
MKALPGHFSAVMETLHNLLLKIQLLLLSALRSCHRKLSASVEPIDEILSGTDVLSGLFFPCNFTLYPAIPRKRSRDKILALDLDQTLVCASPKPLSVHHHWIQTAGSALFVCERPYLQFFLTQVSQWYKVAIFTAGTKAWAAPIINQLDPGGARIEKRYFRQFCSAQQDGSYLKDLSLITTKNRIALSKCILVDDTPVSYQLYPDNAFPIPSFYAADYDTDTALLELLPVLHALQYVQDVRSLLSWRTRRCPECLPTPAGPPMGPD